MVVISVAADGDAAGASPGGNRSGKHLEVTLRKQFSLALVLLLGVACRQAPARTATRAQAVPPAPTTAAATVAPQTGGQAPAGARTAPGEQPAAKPVPAQLPAVVARVNGEAIGRVDFEQAIKSVEARAGGQVPAEQRNQIYRQVLDQLVSYHLLAQESRARKLPVPDTEVEARLNEVRKQFPSEEAFNKALSDQKVTLERLRQDARLQLEVSKLIEAETKAVPAPDQKDVAGFYDQNKDKFQEPEAVHARHILIRLPEKADDAARKQARAKAEEILGKLKAGGDFAALARENSQDPGSAQNGGDLGFFGKGQMVPAFEKAAFALKPGETSGVVETPFGFHIINVIERRPPRTVPLPEVSGKITQYLTDQRREARTTAFVEQLKSKAKIEILI